MSIMTLIAAAVVLILALLILADMLQTPKRILAGFGDGNKVILRLYNKFGLWAVRAWFLAWLLVLALVTAALLVWWPCPGSLTLLLAPFIAFQLYCVGGNIKRGFMPW